MSVFDYGDVLHMHALSQRLHALDTMDLWGSSLVWKPSLTIVNCMNVLDGLHYQHGDLNFGLSSSTRLF